MEIEEPGVGKCLDRHLIHLTIPKPTLNLCMTGRGEREAMCREEGGGGGGRKKRRVTEQDVQRPSKV